jgi:predicted hydrocarbon binding protein
VAERTSADRVVDEVWARALGKIMKQSEGISLRPNLGDDIDLLVPQSVTTALLSQNPAFARVLYSSAEDSARRNAYLVVRRLGMPPVFFRIFDHWSDDRAYTTLRKLIDRVFSSLMRQQKQGVLDLVSVDVEKGRLVVSFSSCVECYGVVCEQPICFFHAGMFAGVLGALLDREFDVFEQSCWVKGGQSCVFAIGPRDSREIAVGLQNWHDSLSPGMIDVSKQAVAALDGGSDREIGNLVDIGYYQLLLSSSILTNLALLETACFGAGTRIGDALAPLLRDRFPGGPAEAISGFYSQLRYIGVAIAEDGDTVDVQVAEAPESLGPMADTTLAPFLCGELESLLSGLGGRRVRFVSSEPGKGGPILRFSARA